MTTLSTPVPEVSRDRWQRPLITPPGGGKAIAYTRCTTFVGCLEDTYSLSRWQQRMVATGLSMRPDLQLAVSAHKDDKGKLDKICEDATEAAAAHGKATIGTALHALTERIDRGLDVGVIPDAYKADLAAYEQATKDLVATHIEQLTVDDALQVAGTPDRVVKFQGKRYIADVKTGTLDYGAGKIAMQLAVYARSQTYDHVTNTRSDHGADLKRAIIIHLPAGEGICRLVWVDIEAGWHAVALARKVREWRKKKFNDLCEPVGSTPGGPDLATLIHRAGSLDTLTALWLEHQGDWTEEHTRLAKEERAAIEKDIELDSLQPTG